MKRFLTTAVLIGVISVIAPALAATVTVKGSVTQPPCTVNGGSAINVPFGDDVMTTRIDGVAYKKMPLDYTIECEGDMSGASALEIQIKGTAASFDTTLLKTSVDGLGVKFLTGSTTLVLNSGAAKFDYLADQTPAIDAVLTRDPSVTLAGGAFSATATMYVNYQ
ncbi:fimbrial protein [Klebsiella aerogenes]|uniref:fimbrial protein n=1 Tax=Klebsiella aerogenes TaxID=548 RepID=UPI00351CD15F